MYKQLSAINVPGHENLSITQFTVALWDLLHNEAESVLGGEGIFQSYRAEIIVRRVYELISPTHYKGMFGSLKNFVLGHCVLNLSFAYDNLLLQNFNGIQS